MSVGLALSAPELPPRVERDGHVLVLTSLAATVTTSARQPGEEELALQPSHTFTVDLTRRWSELARGERPRGDYDKVKLDFSALALAGTYDGADFRIVAEQPKSFELSCRGWRVELGTRSAVSMVADPRTWMAKLEGGQLEPLAPDEQAASELMNRFMASLQAVRDDDHDGVEDPDHH